MGWSGKDQAKQALESTRRRVIDAAQSAVTEGSLLLQTQQRLNATHRPGPLVRSGSLWRGIVTIPTRQTGAFVYTGGTKATTVYSRIIDQGGTIYPKRGMFLVWTDGPRPMTAAGWTAANKQGLVHRARMVTIRPHPYFGVSIPQVAPRYRELAARHVAAALVGG